MLLVEQHVRQALSYADRAYVMRRGRIELSGSATELSGRSPRSRTATSEHAHHRRPSTDQGTTTWPSPDPSSRSPPPTTSCASALEVADLPALLPALAHVTGDHSLLRPDLRIDPLLMGEDQGGLTPEQQEAIRELALQTLITFRDGGSVDGTDADRRRPEGDPRVHGRRPGDRRVPADDARGAGPDGRPPSAPLAQGRRQPGSRLPGRDHRRRHVGHRRRLPPGRGRRAVHRARQERRRRRHVAGEQLSRVPGRHPEPLLQLLVRPARRLAALLQPALRAAQVLPRVRRRVRHPPEHPLQHRGLLGRVGRGHVDVDGVHGRRRRQGGQPSRPTP